IVLYHLHTNTHSFLIVGSLLGLILEIFNNSGGVHTTACITLAFIRENLLKMSFGYSYEFHIMRITDNLSSELVVYVISSVIIHRTVLIFLEVFNINFIVEILLRTITSSIFTVILIFLIIGLIKYPRK